MKAIYSLFIFLFLISGLHAQFQFDEDQLLAPSKYGEQIANSFEISEVYEYIPDSSELKVNLKNGLRSADYLYPEMWTAINNDVKVEAIKIVFSKYPIRKNGYSMNYPLLCDRLKNLFKLDPFLNDSSIRWEIILQTNCIDDEQVDQLFHGVVIEFEKEIAEEPEVELLTEDTILTMAQIQQDTFKKYDPLDDLPEELQVDWEEKSEAEKTATLIEYYEEILNDTAKINVTPTLLEKEEDRVTDFINQHNYSNIKDSTVLKVFERNPQWEKILVVADWTGSMYQYGAEASLWHILNFEKSGMEYLTLFNDGDHKQTYEKQLGETDGIYFEEASDVDKLIELYNLVMLKGGGGDGPENDLEAIIKGIEKYPDHVDIVLIADNGSCVRDMKLLDEIKRPVRVILCGYNELIGANPQYVKIAQQTGGSLHTVEADIYKLALEASGSKGVKLMEDLIRIGELPCLNRGKMTFGPSLKDTVYTDFNFAKKNKKYTIHLDLSNQKLKKIPKKINKIQRVETVDLSHNHIVKISSSIYFSKSIKNLNFAHNRISNIPIELERMQQLVRLDLSYNNIDSLENTFYRLKKLKHLSLSNNQLRHLPKKFNARYLEEFYLDNNQLEELPSAISRLKNIKIFSIKNNKLTAVSKKISYMKKLELLDLSDNNLTQLPVTISRLKNLKRLILSGNNFSREELIKLHQLLPNTEIEYQ